MLAKNKLKYSIGGLFLCTKCGLSFSDENFAEKLKSELRTDLKNDSSDQLKIRVMTSSCLGVCEKGQQAFIYKPNDASTEVYTFDPNSNKDSVLKFIVSKIKLNN